MGTLQSSGVYIYERDLSEVIIATASAVGAFVFASSKGPINERTLITTSRKFKETFGLQNAKVSFAHYCILAYLQNSNQAWCTRIVGDNYTYAGLLIHKVTKDVEVVALAKQDPKDGLYADTNPLNNIAFLYQRGPGSYGENIAVEFQSDNVKAITTGATATAGSSGTAITGTPTYKVTVINSSGEFEYVTDFGTIAVGSGLASLTLTWPSVRSASAYNVYYKGVLLTSVTDVTYTHSGESAIGKAYPTEFSPTVADFNVLVYDYSVSKGLPAEKWSCTFKQSIDGFGVQTEMAEVINTQSYLIRCVNHGVDFASVPVIYDTPKQTLSGGSSGNVPTTGQHIKGWDLYASTEDVSVNLLVNCGYAIPAIQAKMDAVAHTRGDSVALLDVPSSKQAPQDAVNYRRNDLNLNSNRSALYTPDVKVYDEENDISLYVPPSGHIAGVYAFNDFVSQAWFAPAGLNRGLVNIQGLRHIYEQGDRDLLAPNQVNYIRKFPGQGYAVWEQLTMQAKASALSYVNVRRLLDTVEVAVGKFLLYSVHEPNDDITRIGIVTAIGQFLDSIKNKRGIKRFQIICDDSNNSPQTVSQGELNIDVYIEPVLAASKLKLNMVIMRQGMSFSEAIAAAGSN